MVTVTVVGFDIGLVVVKVAVLSVVLYDTLPAITLPLASFTMIFVVEIVDVFIALLKAITMLVLDDEIETEAPSAGVVEVTLGGAVVVKLNA